MDGTADKLNWELAVHFEVGNDWTYLQLMASDPGLLTRVLFLCPLLQYWFLPREARGACYPIVTLVVQ